MKIIYENKKPKSAIARDRLQWILCYSTGGGRLTSTWVANSYFANLSNLFEQLAEDQFKNFTNKIKHLKELDKSIDKTYTLIDKVSQGLEKQLIQR